MIKKKKKILILTVKWGHLSIAKAIKDTLDEKKYQISLEYIEVNKFSNDPYELIYKLFPSLSEIPFKISGNQKISKTLVKTLHKIYLKKVNFIFLTQKPDIVINTYFAFNSIIEELSKTQKFLYINVVTDPWTFHRVSVSKTGYNFVFDKTAQQNCIQFGVNKDKCIQSGWFVRKEFINNLKVNNLRKQLNLTSDFCLCVVGGSVGTYSVLKVIPALFKLKKNIEVIFICGENKKLLKSVKLLSKLTSLKEKNITIIPIGFSNEIHKYIQVSDLVIGKAGPNLLFETVATRTPFFAISHIHGQENGNLEIIKKYKLGFVEEDSIRATKLLRKIINNPKILHRFQKPLEKMAKYNEKSDKILNEFIKSKI